jgi:hypothetical protein
MVTLRCNPDETGEHFRQRLLSIEYNSDGVPIVAHIRCTNKECCPKVEGQINVHLFTLWGVQNNVPVGKYVTIQLSTRTLEQMPLGARVARGAA